MNHLLITGRNEVLAKVIFLHLSVIHSVHRGGGTWPGTPPDQVHPPWDQVNPPPGPGKPSPLGPGTPPDHPPRDQVHPLGPGTPPGPGTPQDQVPPPGPGTPPPPEQQPPEYGQRSAGTHPTGMHSCFKL